MSAPEHPHSIRSYVLRGGRITSAQQRALEALWQNFGADAHADLPDLHALFGRAAPRVLEIGFGDGQSLAVMAEAEPQSDFLGIEVHRPGVGRLMMRAHEKRLTNLRVIRADATEVLSWHVADASFKRIQIFFPDPWPKKRHHKRRLIQPPFVRLLADKLEPGGHLHLATDWEHYALQMLEVLTAEQALVNTAGPGNFASRPQYRPLTKFERRGQHLGHGIWDLVFARRAAPSNAAAPVSQVR